jgi:DoxX-like family
MATTNAQLLHPIAAAGAPAPGAADARPLDARPSRGALWTGRALGGVASLFLLADALMKVLELPVAVQGTQQVGYPKEVVFGLGVVQLVCLAAYLVPRTAVLGAVLWTGYLGGAVATHVRIGDPLLSHVLAPVYVALFLWGGLWLRDARVRAVLPVRGSER